MAHWSSYPNITPEQFRDTVNSLSSTKRGESVPPSDYVVPPDPFNGAPPDIYKYIWLSFRNLPDEEQNLAPGIVKFNSDWDRESQLSKNYVVDFNTNSNYVVDTYAQWLQLFPDAERLPRFWTYSKSTNPFNRQSGRGSRRSLQKSRLVKRKSRKYKSIKKSKKRSFRKRSGKY